MSLLPPGRFLMPGNLAGSPALTFAPLDVRGRRQRARRFAVGDDAAALRGLQGRRGAAVLPRSFCPARSPDRAGRCARRVQRRAGSAARSRSRARRHSRLLPRSAAARSSAACSGRGSTASCSPPPRPIICITRAMTGWRRCCGAPSPRPPTRAEYAGAAIDVVALAAVRATREAQVARGRDKLPSILGTPAPGESRQWRGLRRRDRGRDLSGRPARRSRGAVQGRRFAASPARLPNKADFRFLRFRPPLLERDGDERARAASHPPRPRPPVPDRRPTAMSERRRIGGRRRSSSTIPAWS